MAKHFHPENDIDRETAEKIDKAVEVVAKVAGRGIVTFAVSRTIIKPLLEDLTGRKIRSAPLWLTFDILYNVLINVPHLRATQLRREEEDHQKVEDELRRMGMHHE